MTHQTDRNAQAALVRAAASFVRDTYSGEWADDAAATLETDADLIERGEPCSLLRLAETMQPAAVSAAVAPPTNQTALRDRIAEALMQWAEGNNSPKYTSMRRPETVVQNAYSRADAVLAVLPEAADRAARRDRVAEAALAAVETALCDTLLPDAREEALDRLMKVLPEVVDRAAVLREEADRIDATRAGFPIAVQNGITWATAEMRRHAAELRRMADETATETPAAERTAEDIAREHVTSLHLIGEQLATIESWFWEHLADVRDAGARQDGTET